MNKIKEDMAWIQKAGDDLLASFILPPLQVIAAAINFCTLLVSGDRDLRVEDIPHLKADFGAVAGDWESGAIAWVATRNNTRCSTMLIAES